MRRSRPKIARISRGGAGKARFSIGSATGHKEQFNNKKYPLGKQVTTTLFGKKTYITRFDNAYKVFMPGVGTSINKTIDGAKKQLKYDYDKKLDAERELTESYKLRFPEIKRFYFKIDKSNPAKYGGSNVTASIYEDTKDGLKKVTDVKWQTASYRGNDSEVLVALKKANKIPSKMFPTNYYRYSDAEKYNMKISQL